MFPIVCILLSVVAVMLASIESFMDRYGHILTALEWAFTLLFTFEYLVTDLVRQKPMALHAEFLRLGRSGSDSPHLSESHADQCRVSDRCQTSPGHAGVSHSEAHPISGELQNHHESPEGQPSQDHRLHVRRHGPRGHHWFDAHHRRTGEWVYQYPSEHVLGSGHSHDRGIRRYRPQTAVGKSLAAIVMIIGYAIIAVLPGLSLAELTKGIGPPRREAAQIALPNRIKTPQDTATDADTALKGVPFKVWHLSPFFPCHLPNINGQHREDKPRSKLALFHGIAHAPLPPNGIHGL